MAWFSKKQPVAVVEPELVAEKKKVVTGPRLAVLIPDIAGISSFLFSLQDEVGDAQRKVAGLRADVRRGTHAFWAMHDRPDVDESMHVETLVLIRAKTDSDLVYVVSFLDLESALSFTRFELRRGLYIGNVMIYWAAFVQIREELEGVSIIPSIAPPAVDEHLAPQARLAPPLPQASVTIAEPVTQPRPEPQREPELASIAESEARKAVERYLQENPAVETPLPAPQPVAEQPPAIEESIEAPAVEEAPAPVIESLPIFYDEPVTEEAAVADALVLQHPPVAEPIVQAEPVAEPTPPEPDVTAQRRPAPFTPKRRWALRDGRQNADAKEIIVAAQDSSPETIAETHLEVVIQMPEPVGTEPTTLEPVTEAFQPQDLASSHPSQSVLEAQEAEALQALADRVTTYAGDEEAEREQAIQVEASSLAVDPAAGMPEAEKYSEFDIALEVERLLKNRKWEARDGPFRGFKSPPGRF